MDCKKTNNNQDNEKSKLKKEYINNSKKYVANTYARFDLVLESGKNATLKDIEGKEYIDLGSGIGVNSIGYGNKNWINTVTNQIKTLQHTSNLYYNKPYIDLAKKLAIKLLLIFSVRILSPNPKARGFSSIQSSLYIVSNNL